MTQIDREELQYLVQHGSESEICQMVAGLPWEDLDEAYRIIARAGVTENDVMQWIYVSLK